MITDYEIILIIITIITIIISLAFYVFFVYIPAARAADQLDILVGQGEDVITLVEDRIETVKEDTADTLFAVCKTVCTVVQDLNNLFMGIHCKLEQQAIPAYCDPLVFNVDGLCGGVS